ncbi:MAG: GNAT family N-acetyltransferase [Chloroflexi bacterium]|nr:GNAT family N-acetyltransferase [Chloroflexota bacterium]
MDDAQVDSTPASALSIRATPQPGDLGWIVTAHAELYAREYGFGPGFETYVIETVAEYVRMPSSERHRIWIAEADGRRVGCVAILGRERGEAQLRWFLTDPAVRGQGLGRRLLREAVAFCRRQGFRSIYLWTVNGLDAAAQLYREAGFTRTETRPEVLLWGIPLCEERHDLPLT